jgi:hypothetical protein
MTRLRRARACLALGSLLIAPAVALWAIREPAPVR